MAGETSNTLEDVEEGKIGAKGRICIWGLAFLIYGGGMGLWFVSMPVVKPVVQGILSFLYLFSSNDDEISAAYSYDDLPPDEDEEVQDEPEAEVPEAVMQEPTRVTTKPSLPAADIKAISPWPSVKVVGVMTKQGKRSVMLGVDIVPVADSTLGMTVAQIDADRVLLEYEGEKKWLRVGDLTDRESR